MGIRRRIAYAYPGKHKVGIAGVVMDDKRVHKIAIGSLERSVVPALLTSFKPDELVVAIDKLYDQKEAHVFVPDTVKKFRFAHPGWAERRVPLTDRTNPHQGIYIHNVWKLFYDDCIRRSDFILSHLDIDVFDIDWVAANRPTGVRLNDR